MSQLRTVAAAAAAFPPAGSGIVGALEIAAEPTAVLNEHRQVVFANQAFKDLVGADSVEDLCGGRPGEVLGCTNAEGGCGDSPACRFCGAAQAIMETLRTGRSLQRDCHIAAADGQRMSANDFIVRTTAFAIGGTPFVLIGFLDVGPQKKRQALERIFFHDILNTASSFKVHLQLLRREMAAGTERLVARLEAIADTLVEEIQGQKILLSAENGTLSVRRDLIDSHAVSTQLIAQLEGQEAALGKKIAIAPFSESFAFVSDDSLIKRILENMLKNALEASPPGATVTLGFRMADAGVRFEVHNASAMEEDVQRKVFRRFFSTKGEDRGLGTWGMKLLAEDYLGGSVSFRSTREDGTTFTLWLPPGGQKTGRPAGGDSERPGRRPAARGC
jgi:signal transduction histidine kinase